MFLLISIFGAESRISIIIHRRNVISYAEDAAFLVVRWEIRNRPLVAHCHDIINVAKVISARVVCFFTLQFWNRHQARCLRLAPTIVELQRLEFVGDVRNSPHKRYVLCAGCRAACPGGVLRALLQETGKLYPGASVFPALVWIVRLRKVFEAYVGPSLLVTLQTFTLERNFKIMYTHDERHHR